MFALVSAIILLISGSISGLMVTFGLNEHFLVLTIGGLVIAGSALISMIVALVMWTVQRDREAALGYTTVFSLAYVDLATVDDRTGYLLRSAGEPLLTREEYENRVAAARAAYSKENGLI
ncbi:hypothetical protein [Rhodoglobus sp.]